MLLSNQLTMPETKGHFESRGLWCSCQFLLFLTILGSLGATDGCPGGCGGLFFFPQLDLKDYKGTAVAHEPLLVLVGQPAQCV